MELLKKNICFYFIMNIFIFLIDWVEELLKEGVVFIYVLVDEFELFNEIVDYKLILVGQEIWLCKSYFKVMGYCKEVCYVWEEENIDVNDIILFVIIYMVVENGFIYGVFVEDGIVIFCLFYFLILKYWEYSL